ncbi:hypothetical protein [Pendulispora albinea]|uniref:Uncharacterized protein n=1 Tax=Pendulispora albinea TaxID=2741071 RepID=A0ABZ2LPE9_9BACT
MPSKSLSGKRLVAVGAAVIAVVALGIFLAFAFVGRKQLVRASLLSEGRRRLGDFGEGVAHCATTGKLPPSSPLVPADFSLLAGAGYRTTKSDWQAEAFTCAHFAPTDATCHYQFRWIRQSDDTGIVQAYGDIDRDEKPDTEMTAPIRCIDRPPKPEENAGSATTVRECGVGPVQEEAITAVPR